jgi:hypothetical protein
MIPYTAVQLTTFEYLRSTCEAPQVPCAFAAALLSSLASQPGDSLLSESATAAEEETLLESVGRLGPRGLFRGTYSRLTQMTVIVVVQLVANDYIREAVGLGKLGG